MKFLYSISAALFLLLTAALPAEATQNWTQVYAHVEQMINKGVEQYNNGDLEGAKKIINDSYYGVYENDGLEKAIRTTISSKNANLTEYQYSELKKAIRENRGKDAVRGEADKLLSMMKNDIESLDSKGAGGGRWTSFWPAFLIMLREGMEAILVLVAIMAYLAKSGNKKYLGTVYNYSIAAVAASFITAYIFSVILGKFTIGASEVSLSGAGHLGQRTTYLFSARQSYLQLLFKALGLPFLPNFIDGQFKTKTRFNKHSELTLLGLVGIDKMKLNTDEKGEDAEYLLSYLPTIHQETFTLGASYRHYNGRHVQSLILSHNYLNNRNLKYRNNDDSSEDNLTLRLRSTEQKTTLRFENQTRLGAWTLKEGAELNNSIYTNHSRQRLYGSHSGTLSIYETSLNIFGWGAFFSSDYTTADKRLALSAGIRMDGNTYNRKMRQLWKQFSPRLSASYKLSEQWTLSGSTGLYHQLPPYTALGYKDNEEQYLNKGLKYMQVFESSLGLDWHLQDRFMVSAEGFFKRYSRMPLSLQDNIPLACKGNDYGVTGNEALAPTASGRAYGLETMFRWQASGKFNLVSSFTLYRSEYRNRSNEDFIPSAWDNRFILNMSGTYNLPRRWSIGGKLSYIGGSPYTPYDEDKSSLVEAWDAKGQPYYDYAYYNTGRLPNFAQLDLRVDKSFYFHHCMIGIYLDIQNITGNKLKQPDVIMSTGIIENPSAPVAEQRYKMKYLKQESGTILPTLGITVEF